MRNHVIAALALFAGAIAAPAAVQAQSAAAPQAAAGKLSVEKTPIGVIWANPQGKAVLVKQLPEIEMYLEMIKEMTLVQVAPMSGGVIDDAKLKAIQADLDAVK